MFDRDKINNLINKGAAQLQGEKSALHRAFIEERKKEQPWESTRAPSASPNTTSDQEAPLGLRPESLAGMPDSGGRAMPPESLPMPTRRAVDAARHGESRALLDGRLEEAEEAIQSEKTRQRARRLDRQRKPKPPRREGAVADARSSDADHKEEML